jgi:hypothetical protein
MSTNKNVSGASAVVELTPAIILASLNELQAEREGMEITDADLQEHVALGGRALAAAYQARKLGRSKQSQFALLGFYSERAASAFPPSDNWEPLLGLRALAEALVRGEINVFTEKARDHVLGQLEKIQSNAVDAGRAPCDQRGVDAWVAVCNCTAWLAWNDGSKEKGVDGDFEPNSAAEDCARDLAAALTRQSTVAGDDFLRSLERFARAEMAKPAPIEKPAKAKRAGRRAA